MPPLPRHDDWIPPPRFGAVAFEGYRPTDPSQAEALARVAAFVAPRPRPRWPWRSAPAERPGLYLDGGFGVGKTHLMAAAWHASREERKVYLSFAELVAAIGTLGVHAAHENLGRERLYCIDEFELDDPGNTLLVKRFLAFAIGQGARVITTSNTAPGAQGEGRFDAAAFQREIQSVAAHFAVLSLQGVDYRTQLVEDQVLENEVLDDDALDDDALDDDAAAARAPRGAVEATWEELHAALARIHPVRYGAWLRSGGAWVIRDARVIPDQQRALRFVHFIDKAYDQRVPLWLTGGVRLSALFDPSYAHGAYRKKHDRARSRLGEMLREARRYPAEANAPTK
jgi:cell division protein ZapE